MNRENEQTNAFDSLFSSRHAIGCDILLSCLIFFLFATTCLTTYNAKVVCLTALSVSLWLLLLCESIASKAKSTWDFGDIEIQSTKSSANIEIERRKKLSAHSTTPTTTIPSNNPLNNEWAFFCWKLSCAKRPRYSSNWPPFLSLKYKTIFFPLFVSWFIRDSLHEMFCCCTLLAQRHD